MKREFEGEEVGEIKKPKLPKKRVAILLGYIGTNYCGLQFQLGKNSTPSIEETVFESLVKVGGVSQENSDDIRKVGWFRASRTDKGVHALMNIVTLKVTFQDDMIKKLNETLPKDIMVHDILRVTNSFNPKKNCEFRVYEFILPTYCLEKNDKWKDFRITKERLEKVQNLLNHYVGTVSFHNFTKKESESKDYYRRIIKSYNVSEPRMIQDYECVSLIVNGNSCMFYINLFFSYDSSN